MKTIKVIDLLNKIANGEEVPKCIMYQGHYYYNVGNEEQAYYENTELDDNLFLYAIHNEGHLNDEVEIIEEDTPKEDKKIEKLGAFNIKKFCDDYPETAQFILAMFNKQEELIDKVNGDK